MDNNKRSAVAARDILPGILKDLTRNHLHEQIALEQVWSNIAGEGATGVALGGFRDGVVFITVDSSARLYYWKLRQGTIVKRFQERRPDVRNVVFKIGKVT